MRMVLIVSLCRSLFSCFGNGSKKRYHDDRSHTSSTTEVSGAGGAPRGVTGAEVADTGPRLGDSTKSLL
jgi:hypothetical protein